MDGDAAPDRDFLAWCLRQQGVSHAKLTSLSPDFLVVSPPKTGSTWLAANLRCHPQVYVPDFKEVKYFSSFWKWLDLGWYLDQFSPGADRRAKGEASPSYAVLPVAQIRLVRRLFPGVKVLFLMRDPVARAWSHARHNHRYREANFASCDADFAAVSDAQWCHNFTHDWPLAGGDYLGQLRRWLSVFPREQLFVGFYESIAEEPESLLRQAFHFLGVDPNVDLAGFRVREKILAGPPGELTQERANFLRRLLAGRTLQLQQFLREQFGLELPPAWQNTLRPATGGLPAGVLPPADEPAAFARAADDPFLVDVLAHEESLPAEPCMVLKSYRGFNIVFHRGRMVALAESLGPVHLQEVGEDDLRRHFAAGDLFTAPSLAEAKDWVTQHVFRRTQGEMQAVQSRQDDLETELLAARERVRRLEVAQGEAFDVLRALEADTLRLSPRELAWVHLFRRTLRLPRDLFRRARALLARPRQAAPQTLSEPAQVA